jgi:ABC-type nitrate/sulfonate/bicarbonate transport system permease component
MPVRLRPVAFIAILVAVWQFAVNRSSVRLLPGPVEAAGGIVDLARHGLLVKYVTASLFRVTWGFMAAAVVAIPSAALEALMGLHVSCRRLGTHYALVKPAHRVQTLFEVSGVRDMLIVFPDLDGALNAFGVTR